MIGTRLRQLRKERKYSLRMLSQKSGISYGFICDIENGRSNPSIANLRILASALGVTADIFLRNSVVDNDHETSSVAGDDPWSKNQPKDEGVN